MLKKAGITIFLGIISLWCAAQPKGGDFLLGGSVSFSRNRGEIPVNAGAGITTETQFKFNPNAGVFLSKRFAMGISPSIAYLSNTNSFVLRDSANKEFRGKTQYFKLTFGFGVYGSYYAPLADKLYLVNTLDTRWGSFVEGDRLASLLAENKPQQDRVNFMEVRHTIGLQYFMKPTVGLTVGFSPLAYKYKINKQVRDFQPQNTTASHSLEFQTGAQSFFIGINYLIIADKDNE